MGYKEDIRKIFLSNFETMKSNNFENNFLTNKFQTNIGNLLKEMSISQSLYETNSPLNTDFPKAFLDYRKRGGKKAKSFFKKNIQLECHNLQVLFSHEHLFSHFGQQSTILSMWQLCLSDRMSNLVSRIHPGFDYSW